MRKGFWKDYFSFSKKERIGIFILLFIIVVFVILPYFFTPHFKKPVVEEQLQKQLAALQNSKPDNSEVNEQATLTRDTTIEKQKPQPQLFYFDPNTLDEIGWKKLGVSDKTIHTIINYRNKGGHFYKPEDIRKIYGLKKEEADALISYIKIESTNTKEIEQEKNVVDNKPSIQSYESIKKIDINTGTAADFKALPGIGDVLSNRIVKFRNSMHGFKSVEDIKRTYGLPDSTYNNILPYLTINDSTSQKN
jgi:competence protein ComEA